MKTSFAFIKGLVPPVFATELGPGAMIAIGVPVFSGMLAASTVGMLLISMLYVTFQRLHEKTGQHPITEG